MLNDDLISAYLDGELDAERRAIVEDHLRNDKGATARLDRMRAADAVLERAFPASERGEDDRLAAMILASPQPPARAEWLMRAAALAAATVFGLVLGQTVRGSSDTGAAYSVSPQEARLLDTQLSGEVIETPAGAFEVVLTVQSQAGEVCREFRLTRDMQSTDVLACRGNEGGWRMVAAAAATRVEGFVPAGGQSPLDVAIDALGPVEVLDAAQEGALIERRWRTPPQSGGNATPETDLRDRN